MVKHSRKKQKLARTAKPLGTVRFVNDEAAKDDEERRLESILFGTDYEIDEKGKGRQEDFIEASDEEELSDAAVNGFEQFQDADLFFIDNGKPNGIVDEPSFNFNYGEDGASDRTEDNEEDDRASTASSSKQPITQPSKTRKKAAWVDADDAGLSISLANAKRLRKLRDAPSEDVVGGTQYEARLRREFERINPAPEWAAKARKKQNERKRRRVSGSEVDLDDQMEGTGSALDELLNRTDGIVSNSRPRILEKGMIGVDRLRDANQSAKSEGEIRALSFHPSPRVPVLMTASSDRRVRLFNVDGHTNPHLQTIHIPELPITNAIYHPNGSSLLLTGPRPFYYIFDLQSGTTSRSPRGLWGTNPANQQSRTADMGMERCAFDPSGSILAVAGRRGHIHLIDWRSGPAQVVGDLKLNSGIQALWWNQHPGSVGPSELMTLSSDAEVYVWDVAERRCIKRWKEEGGYGATVMSGDPNGKYLSIGSKTGLVSIYGEDGSISSQPSSPKALKTLKNLTTSISALRFNHDSQLLAMSSNVKKDQMRLVHLPSLTAYSNWPTSSTPLGHVTAIDFSPSSDYIAIGNNRGRALLYQILHFTNVF